MGNNKNIKKYERSDIVENQKGQDYEAGIEDVERRVEEIEEVRREIKEEGEDALQLIINEAVEGVNKRDIRRVSWWMKVLRKDRYRIGDIIFDEKLERFGIFIFPGKKEGLIRMRLFKKYTKYDIYTRDWFVNFNDTVLVRRRRSKRLNKGFIDTNKEFLERPGRVRMRLSKKFNLNFEE